MNKFLQKLLYSHTENKDIVVMHDRLNSKQYEFAVSSYQHTDAEVTFKTIESALKYYDFIQDQEIIAISNDTYKVSNIVAIYSREFDEFHIELNRNINDHRKYIDTKKKYLYLTNFIDISKYKSDDIVLDDHTLMKIYDDISYEMTIIVKTTEYVQNNEIENIYTKIVIKKSI